MREIILDTDIGSDIDDAFALVLAARCKQIKLLGVTTLYRNADLRARLARLLLDECGRKDVPVSAGIDAPLIQIPEEAEPSWAPQRYWEYGKYVPLQCDERCKDVSYGDGNAVSFLVHTLRRQPSAEIVTIGPATNLAVAVRLAPDIAVNRRCTLMAGCLNKLVLDGKSGAQYVPEWNVFADPEAMRILLTSGLNLNFVGLDVALSCRLQPETVRGLGGANQRTLDGLLKKWKESVPAGTEPVMYDPLTVASLEDEGILSWRRCKISVGLTGKMRGVFYEDAAGTEVNFAVGVDVGRFNELFRSYILNGKE